MNRVGVQNASGSSPRTCLMHLPPMIALSMLPFLCLMILFMYPFLHMLPFPIPMVSTPLASCPPSPADDATQDSRGRGTVAQYWPPSRGCGDSDYKLDLPYRMSSSHTMLMFKVFVLSMHSGSFLPGGARPREDEGLQRCCPSPLRATRTALNKGRGAYGCTPTCSFSPPV